MKDTESFLSPSDYIDMAMPKRPPSPNPDYRPMGEEERERRQSGHEARVAAWEAACEERSRQIATARDGLNRKRQNMTRSR